MFPEKIQKTPPPENTPPADGYTIESAAPALSEDARTASQYSPIALAFLGDAVYSLLARERLLHAANRPARDLHRLSLDFVSAAAQAKALTVLLPFLTDEEHAVYKRGRNAHSAHMPKNQTPADYRSATGLEAVFGYLYLSKNEARIRELFSRIAGELDGERQNKK